MTPPRTSGSAGRARPSLEINLLTSVTRDHEYYNRLPTGEYPAHVTRRSERRHDRAIVMGIAAATIVLGGYGLTHPAPPFESAPARQEEPLVAWREVAMRNRLETGIDSIIDTYVKNPATRAFFEQNLPHALAMEERYGVPAELSMAKAIIESRLGQSELARKGNNYFGLKESKTFKQDYPGIITLLTKEYVDGEYRVVRARFTHYDNPRQSFEHFARVVTRFYPQALTTSDPHAMAERLNKAGYSTAHDATVATSRALNEYRLVALLNDIRRFRTPVNALADD